MSCRVTLAQLISVLDATPVNISDDASHKQAIGITTDTRNLKTGEVFVALRGEKFDGHQFIQRATDSGALAAIVDSRYPISDAALPLLVVQDTLQAYQAIARWWRNQFDIPVIAVTGSVGKTSTKELIAAVLSSTGNVLKTQLNYNNEIGVPKTLLELTSEHDYAVIEMGMRGTGEIALLAQIARPTVSVITNVGTAHIERLGSEEAIARAKCELLANMDSTGVAILNYDNPLLMKTAATVWHGQTLTYGLEGGDLRGESIGTNTLKVEGVELPVPLAGRHNAINYLAALAVAKLLCVSWEPFKGGFAVELPEGRSRRYDLANDIVILDETYNAGLESMTAALHLLAQTAGKRRIAVLGTMKELGERSLEFHQQVGTTVRQLNLDGLFIFADPAEAEAMAIGAIGLSFVEIRDISKPNSHEELAKRLQEFVQPGDRVLFKASHSVELNRVVELFRA